MGITKYKYTATTVQNSGKCINFCTNNVSKLNKDEIQYLAQRNQKTLKELEGIVSILRRKLLFLFIAYCIGIVYAIINLL